MSFGVEAEFRKYEEQHWNVFFQELGMLSSDLPFKHAKLPENKGRNRYREVSPFDHSRVRLQSGTNDYINASLVIMKEARRRYILTQGPLPSTCGHFWQMVWEQRSLGVVMLNRIIELGSVKCTQYWPPREIRELVFRDTGFKLTLIKEDEKANCTIRHLELENMKTQETRHVIHFHYTAWPDFGLPETPTSFLSFILFVRVSGCLAESKGPTVVHCSAGIGRSGVFCLVDTCLQLMSIRKKPYSVRVRDVLLQMRKYRMDLVQTAQQLRFAYIAIIEGTKPILRSLSMQDSMNDSDEEDSPLMFTPTAPPTSLPRHIETGSEESCFYSGTEEEDYVTHEAGCSAGPSWRDVSSDPSAPVSWRRSGSALGLALRTAGDQAAAGPPQRRGDGASGPATSLLAGVYLCATLVLGAYICYRASFH